MTIGQQLKQCRLSLGLTQAQMCQGVVTSSFYSRVESDNNRISVNSLLKILNNHNLSLYDFFINFDLEKLQQNKLQSQILAAFDCCDIDQLTIIEKILENDNLKLEVQLMLISLSGDKSRITDTLKNKIHYDFIKIGNWNNQTLWALLLTIPLYDTEKLNILVASIIENCNQINLRDKQNLEILAHILIKYVQRCYQEEQREKAESTIEFIMDLPAEPSIALAKVLSQLYLAKLDHDNQKVNTITKLLNQSGYSSYSK